jgi:hypothetical protein
MIERMGGKLSEKKKKTVETPDFVLYESQEIYHRHQQLAGADSKTRRVSYQMIIEAFFKF